LQWLPLVQRKEYHLTQSKANQAADKNKNYTTIGAFGVPNRISQSMEKSSR
jgi:hypothetical protein